MSAAQHAKIACRGPRPGLFSLLPSGKLGGKAETLAEKVFMAIKQLQRLKPDLHFGGVFRHD